MSSRHFGARSAFRMFDEFVKGVLSVLSVQLMHGRPAGRTVCPLTDQFGSAWALVGRVPTTVSYP